MTSCDCKECRHRKVAFALGLSAGAILGTAIGWLSVEIGRWLAT